MLNIRLMRKEDCAQVASIERENFSEPWSEDAFEESVDKQEYCFLVAEKNSFIVGYAGMYFAADEGNITTIAVAEPFRGQRIATMLLQELEQNAIRKGTTRICLEVRISNTDAIALYHKAGYQEDGTRKNFYRLPTEDALLMSKTMIN